MLCKIHSSLIYSDFVINISLKYHTSTLFISFRHKMGKKSITYGISSFIEISSLIYVHKRHVHLSRKLLLRNKRKLITNTKYKQKIISRTTIPSIITILSDITLLYKLKNTLLLSLYKVIKKITTKFKRKQQYYSFQGNLKRIQNTKHVAN